MTKMDPLKKQKELQEFKDSLKGKTLDELHELEKQLIKDADENDVKVANMEFDLPEENYKIAAEAIQKLLDKQEVQWQYALAMVAIYDFWDPNKKPGKIGYPMLDSTLRTLGDLRLKGYAEWAAIVAINTYFGPLRETYGEALEVTYDISAKHDAVLNAITELSKAPEEQMITE